MSILEQLYNDFGEDEKLQEEKQNLEELIKTIFSVAYRRGCNRGRDEGSSPGQENKDIGNMNQIWNNQIPENFPIFDPVKWKETMHHRT